MSTLTAPQHVIEPNLADAEQQKMWDYYEQEVLKGLESDKRIPYDSKFWDKIHADVEQRLQATQAEKKT